MKAPLIWPSPWHLDHNLNLYLRFLGNVTRKVALLTSFVSLHVFLFKKVKLLYETKPNNLSFTKTKWKDIGAGLLTTFKSQRYLLNLWVNYKARTFMHVVAHLWKIFEIPTSSILLATSQIISGRRHKYQENWKGPVEVGMNVKILVQSLIYEHPLLFSSTFLYLSYLPPPYEMDIKKTKFSKHSCQVNNKARTLTKSLQSSHPYNFLQGNGWVSCASPW